MSASKRWPLIGVFEYDPHHGHWVVSSYSAVVSIGRVPRRSIWASEGSAPRRQCLVSQLEVRDRAGFCFASGEIVKAHASGSDGLECVYVSLRYDGRNHEQQAETGLGLDDGGIEIATVTVILRFASGTLLRSFLDSILHVENLIRHS